MSARCRVCGGSAETVIDLGVFPLANAFLLPSQVHQPEPTYPLAVQRCAQCTLLQLTETVDPRALFADYLYTPSASVTWRAHCSELAAFIRARAPERPFVLEVGSNDGCFLREAKPFVGRMLGVDPAANIAEIARGDGIPTEVSFFGLQTARDIVARHGAADVIVGTNVLAHAPDLLDFLRGVAVALAPSGRFVVEVPYLAPLLDGVAFDTIYHEHVSYFSAASLGQAYARAGLRLIEVGQVDTHGGSLRAVATHEAAGMPEPAASIARLLAQERDSGLNTRERLVAFVARVDAVRAELLGHFARFRAAKLRVAGYGATAKGNTLLQYLGLGPGEVTAIGDRSPLKQGRFTPGTHIPVVSPEALEAMRPDVLLVLAWNLADEIRAQFRALAQDGTRFLIPIPQVVLTGTEAGAAGSRRA